MASLEEAHYTMSHDFEATDMIRQHLERAPSAVAKQWCDCHARIF